MPSTVHTVVTGGDLLASTRAAGELLVPARAGAGRRLAAGAVAHALLSIGWSGVLVAILPRRPGLLAGAVAGLGIAALDLRIAHWRVPAIAALPTAPQVADHVAFGMLVALVCRRADRRPRPLRGAGRG